MAARKKQKNSQPSDIEGLKPQAILGKKMEGGTPMYKVKWNGYPNSAATWQAKHTIPNADALIQKFEQGSPKADEEDQWEVEYIVRKRVYRGETAYLTKWKGWSEKSNEWLTRDNFGDEYMVDAFEIREAVKAFRRKINKKLQLGEFEDAMYELGGAKSLMDADRDFVEAEQKNGYGDHNDDPVDVDSDS